MKGHKNDPPKENGRRLDKKLLLQMFAEISAPLKKESSLEAEETHAKDQPVSKQPEDCPPSPSNSN
jgi:hypothetical protein